MPNNQKGFAPIIAVVVLTLLLGTGTAAANLTTTTTYSPQIQQSTVLGDDNELNEQQLKEKEEAAKKEFIKKEELRKQELKVKEELLRKEKELKKEEFKKIEEKKKIELDRSKELKNRIELLRKQAAQNKLKESTVSAEDERDDKDLKEEKELEKQLELLKKELDENDNKVEYEQQVGDLRLRYIYENGKLKVKAKAENGAEIDVDDAEVNMLKSQLENQLKESGIEIATSSSKLVIGKNRIKAKTNFPISVDPETNQLTVTTPNGQKVVTVLPDQAVQNMLSKNILSEVDFESNLERATESAEQSEIELENRNDQVVYKVKGRKEHKLIGLFPVKTETTAYVSAESGEVVAKDESLLSKLIGILSF